MLLPFVAQKRLYIDGSFQYSRSDHACFKGKAAEEVVLKLRVLVYARRNMRPPVSKFSEKEKEAFAKSCFTALSFIVSPEVSRKW